MKTAEAREIIRALANGLNPFTQEALPQNSFYHDATITRALFLAAVALEQFERTEVRAAKLPKKSGRLWSTEEDTELSEAFDRGEEIVKLAQQFQRTPGAIRARLVKLGKVEAGDWTHLGDA